MTSDNKNNLNKGPILAYYAVYSCRGLQHKLKK